MYMLYLVELKNNVSATGLQSSCLSGMHSVINNNLKFLLKFATMVALPWHLLLKNDW